MDKQGKTITIKINGKDRPIKKGGQAGEEKSSTNHLEGIREETVLETAAAKETAEEAFDWILPDPVEKEPPKEYKIVSKQVKKQKGKVDISVWNKKSGKNKKIFFKGFFFTIMFAVFLGSAFGLTILKLVTPESSGSAPAVVIPSAKESGKVTGSTETVELERIQSFIVQNGVWKTEEGAKSRLAKLLESGVYGEVFTSNGQYAIYLSAAGSIEEAKKIGENLKEKGIEVFAKPVELGGGTISGIPEAESRFLKEAPVVYSIVAGGAPENLKKVEDFSVWVAGLDDKSIKDKNVLRAKASLERASKGFIAYQSSNDSKQLAEVQSGLLSFLSAYEKIGK